MIKSFQHKGLERFFRTGSKAGIQPMHAGKLERQLLKLDTSSSPQDMDIAGWKLHPLKYDLTGHWAVTVQANWRLTFKFEGSHAVLVDYQDYH